MMRNEENRLAKFSANALKTVGNLAIGNDTGRLTKAHNNAPVPFSFFPFWPYEAKKPSRRLKK